MSHTPRLIGTLIVVVLKAKNLPNKRHIGKQDPYSVLRLGTETRRTKAIKRGGQHPEWDEEVRFELFEDIEDELARTAGAGSPPPPPPKDEPSKRARSKEKRIKGGKTMSVSCYADDLREPELIGETTVDLTEALTKGETDEWFTLMAKDKYCGEVYLELTFWSNEKEPEKKTTPRPSTLHPQYGGPGSFKPSNPGEVPASLRTGNGSAGSSPSGGKLVSLHDRHTSSPVASPLPDSLRPSSSLATLNLYVPPYETKTLDSLSPSHATRPGNVSEFGVNGAVRRRDSFPSFQASALPPPGSFALGGPQYPYSPLADGMNTMSLNDPYSAPPANSGFYPPQPSQFGGALYPSLSPAGGAFCPPQPSATPIPSGFQPMYTGFGPPRPGPTPMPGFVPPPSSMGFHQPYPPQPPAPLPPLQQHHSFPSATPAPSGFGPLPPQAGPPQPQYAPAPTPAPYPAPVPQQLSGSQVTGTPGGRPLPEQPQLSGFGPLAAQSPISFPSAPGQYHPNPAPTPVPIPPVATGFVAPGPPPPLRQPQRVNSLSQTPIQGHLPPQQQMPPQQPPVAQGSLTHQAQPSTYHATPPSAYTQPGFPPAASNAANTFPPLPNPPSHPNFALTQSPQQIRTQLPGPPPPLPKKGSAGSNPLPAPPPLPPWQQRPPSVSEQIQHQQAYPPPTNGAHHPSYPPPPALQGNW